MGDALLREQSAKIDAQKAEKNAKESQEKARRESAVTQAVIDFLNKDLLGHANPVNEPNRNIRLRTLLDRASGKIEGQFTDEPKVEAAIRYTMAQAYLNLGEYSVAEHHASRILEIRSKDLPPESEDLFRFVLLRYSTIIMQGRYRDVLEELEIDFKRVQEDYGKQHELTIEAAYWLSKCYGEVSRPFEGEEIMVEYLPISQEELPEEHWLRAAVVNMRGYFHVSFRRMEEAEAYYRGWIDKFQTQFGREHPFPVRLMHHLATSLLIQAKWDEAKATYEETLALKEKTLGYDHPSRIITLGEYGWYHRYRGNQEEAERLQFKAFEMAKQTLGLSHPETREMTAWLSSLYWTTDRKDLMKSFLGEVLDLDPENQYALEQLARFVDPTELTPLIPDSELQPVTWRYTTENPGPDWNTPDFDDSNWKTGEAPFGNSEEITCHTEWSTRTIWIRQHFNLTSIPQGRLMLKVLQDDSTEIYLNGVEAASRQGWTGRKRLLLYALPSAQESLQAEETVIAVCCENSDFEGVIDLGFYLNPDKE